MLKSHLRCDVSVLHGCYEINDLINCQEVEGTVGCTNIHTGKIFKELFESKSFSINIVEDIVLVELTSVLSCICGLCGGFIDALDVSANTKAKGM